MAHLIECSNPVQPSERKVSSIQDGVTVRQALEAAYPGFVEFSAPTLVSLNGRPLLRADWDTATIQREDVLTTTALPAGTGAEIFFYALVAAAVVYSVYTIATMPKPKDPADTQAPDPVFTINGQRNTAKLMQPIEVAYGRNRLWPSYASRPFNKYEGNEQFLYQLFCLGQGEYEIHGVYIEDTDINSFQNVTYEVVPPGQAVTLFPDNVVTSVEVSRLELFAPNEEQYTIYGPFAVNEPFTQTNYIEVDITLPTGLYIMTEEGDVAARGLQATFEVRQIDDYGTPVGAWFELTHFDKTLATVNPQRYTQGASVPSGRYEIRAWRTTAKDLSTRAQNTISWESVRAFLPNTQDYGDVTMLAVIAQATNNLNDSSSNRINVDCTRKLPIRLNGEWTASVPTRSIAWAFYDIFAATYGGQLEDSFIDLDELERLDSVWEGRQEYFDYVFNQKSTVWEAAKAAARCGRAVPVINGSFVSLVRDEVQSIPMGVFNVENILPGSFKWDVELFDPKEPDSVEVTYVNRVTGKQETVMCLPPNSLGYNPEKVTLAGCTSRDQAYHEGMYIAMSNQLLRENISFRTGLEGYIPSYGDMIAVSWPMPKWGTAGFVKSGSGLALVLSEPVTFEVDKQHYLMLRRDDGTGDGPYLVTAGADEFTVTLASELSQAYDFEATGREPVLFTFGPGDNWTRKCRVVEINPSGEEAVEVTCANYDPSVFQFDQTPAPAITQQPTPPVIPAQPVVPFLMVTRVPNATDYVIVSWGPALGALEYVLQQSTNGADWTDVVTTVAVSYQLKVVKGALYLRVAGIRSGQGPWETWSGTVGSPTDVPLTPQNLELQQPFVGTFAKIQWSSLIDADSYKVKVFKDAGATLLRTANVSGVEYTYNSEMMKLDGTPARALRFQVFGTNEFGDSPTPAQLDVSNPTPTQMTSGFSYQVKVETADTTVYTLNWLSNGDTDISSFRVWGSVSSGFAADDTSKKFEGSAYQTDVSVPKIAHVVNITGVSKANPGVVSYSGPALGNGQKVAITGVGGMVQLNNRTFVVRGATGASFQLYEEVPGEYSQTTEVPVDTTTYDTYTSGGTAAVTPTSLIRQPFYWKVAAIDVWGGEVNPSPQQTAS